MLSEQAKKAFSDLELPYNPVAIKFCRNRPENYQRSEGTDAFCTFLKKAQDENQAFFTTMENDECMGKVVLGMTDLETNHGSGQVMPSTTFPIHSSFSIVVKNGRFSSWAFFRKVQNASVPSDC